MRILGLVGWSGSGKTTLLTALIPLLRAGGMRVSTVKHAHAGFDMDQPDKDSFRHREAGAHEVLITSPSRWVLTHEVTGEEPSLPDVLTRLAPVDLVLVEGFKSHPYPKIEVYRPSLGKPALWTHDRGIIAVASNVDPQDCAVPCLPLDKPDAIAQWIRTRGE